MATLNFTIIYSHTIFTIWKQMSQATEGPKSPHYYFNFTGWILGPRVKLASLSRCQLCFWEMGSQETEERPWAQDVPAGSTCGWCGMQWICWVGQKRRKGTVPTWLPQCAVVFLPLKVCLFTRPPPTPPARKGKVSCYHAMKMRAQIPVALV